MLLLMVAGTLATHADSGSSRRYDYLFLEAMMAREQGDGAAAFELLRHCVSLNPDASEAYYYLAQYYAMLKDADRALANFKRAAELNPQNASYQETLVQAYINNNQTDNAIGALELLAETHTDREDVLEMLVQLYLQKKDYTSAIKTFDRLEMLEGKSERIAYAKSSAYALQGNKEAAIEEVRKLAEQNPNDINYECAYAEVLMRNGEKAAALDIYNKVLREDSLNSRAQMILRTCYKEENDTARADSMTLAILQNKTADKDTRIYLLREEISESESSGGDSTKVLSLFKKALTLPQQDDAVAFLYAAYMELKKMPKDSISPVLERVLVMAPDNASARLRLVNYAWQDNDLDRVIDLCRSARQYNPEEMVFYYFQGMAYYKRDDDDSALNAFQNGISVINDKSDPDIVSDFYALMGDILYQKHREKEAYAAYDSCLQWRDDNISALNNYAYYLSLNGDNLDRAEQMSHKTVEAEPKNATYLDTYAWILFMQQRYAEAKIYIDQALRNDTDSSAVITEHGGDIHAMNGDTERAVELWQQAAKKDPANKMLGRKIRKRKYIKQ